MVPVPDELLALIFQAALPHTRIVDRNAPPLLFTRVCFRWRTIACSLPPLWAQLSVDLQNHPHPDFYQLVHLWLHRAASRSLFLSVSLNHNTRVYPALLASVRLTLDVLASALPRTESLSISLPGKYSLLHPFTVHPAPILKSILFDFLGGDEEEFTHANHLFRSAPALSHFSWANWCSYGVRDIPYSGGIRFLLPPYQTLRSLAIENWVSLHTASTILSNCPNLVHCEFSHFGGGSGNPPENIPTLSLPKLESLVVYQLELDHSFASLLDFLLCPSLHNISFSFGWIDSYAWPQPSFDAFLARSACQLRSLSLEYTGITEKQLISCLERSSPSLTRLEVYDARNQFCVSDDLLRMLTPTGATSVTICPNLRALVLHRAVQCADGMLAAMLRSRTEMSFVTPLDFVDITLAKSSAGNTQDIKFIAHEIGYH